jgi:hypothetical protein
MSFLPRVSTQDLEKEILSVSCAALLVLNSSIDMAIVSIFLSLIFPTFRNLTTSIAYDTVVTIYGYSASCLDSEFEFI